MVEVEDKSSNAVLEEEIQDLTLKLDELHYKLRIKGSTNFHTTNILKQTTNHVRILSSPALFIFFFLFFVF